jgi:membrane protease YdiL (CAAX protease family)
MSTAVVAEVRDVDTRKREPVAGALHTVVLVVILLGGAGLMYFSAGPMRSVQQPNRLGFYATTMLWEWFLTAYVLFGVRRHRTALTEVIGSAWKGPKDFFRDLGIAMAFWIAALIVLAATAKLLHSGGSQQNLKFLAPEGFAQVAGWVALSVTAGICEETIFRGYLQKQFVAWIGSAPAGIVLSGVIFGVCHIYQGVKAVVVITVYGVLFGILAQWRKSVRPGMMTHALHDTVSGLAVKLLPK